MKRKQFIFMLLFIITAISILTGFNYTNFTNNASVKNTIQTSVHPVPLTKNFESIIFNLQEPYWYDYEQYRCLRPEENMQRYHDLDMNTWQGF